MSIQEDYENPSLQSTIPGYDPSGVLFTPLTQKFSGHADENRRNYDYNAVAVAYPNVLFNYKNYQVLYLELSHTKTNAIGVVFNRLGEEFIECFSSYFGGALAKQFVERARLAFQERARQDINELGIVNEMNELSFEASEMDYMPQLIQDPSNKLFIGVFDQVIQGAQYVCEFDIHLVEFTYKHEECEGRVISGYQQNEQQNLSGILYTNSYLYKFTEAEKLGIVFVDDRAVGFIW